MVFIGNGFDIAVLNKYGKGIKDGGGSRTQEGKS